MSSPLAGAYPTASAAVPPVLSHTTARFSVPANAERLSFLNNVSLSAGSFNLDVRPKSRLQNLGEEDWQERMREAHGKDTIDVDVELASLSEASLQATQICLSYRNGGWEVWIIVCSQVHLYSSSQLIALLSS